MPPFPLDPHGPPAVTEFPGELLEFSPDPRHIAVSHAVDLVVAGVATLDQLTETAERILGFLAVPAVPADETTARLAEALASLVHLQDTATAVHSSLWDEAWDEARRVIGEFV